MNYYSILQVSPSATPEEIRRAYVTLMRENYPNEIPPGMQAELFERLNEAYTVLSDPDSRQTYDKQLPRGTTFGVRGSWIPRDPLESPRQWWVRQNFRQEFDREIFGSIHWFLLIKQSLVLTAICSPVLWLLLRLFHIDSDFTTWTSVGFSSIASAPIIWHIAHQKNSKKYWLLLPFALVIHLTIYFFLSQGCSRQDHCYPTLVPFWAPAISILLSDILWFFVSQRYDH